LKGALSDLLAREDMRCYPTEEGLLGLVVALSAYREEGTPLYPQVLICDDLAQSLKVLQCTDLTWLGSGDRVAATFLGALKRCAPLCHDGWMLYLERYPDRFEYGVFRAPYSPSALDIGDTIASLLRDGSELRMLFLRQESEKSVELIGPRGGINRVYFSANPDDAAPPREAVNGLIDACCADVESAIREQTVVFMRRTISENLRRCHGTLLAILPCESDDTSFLGTDMVSLSTPIDFPEMLTNHHRSLSDGTLATIRSYASLFGGMLGCDGITVLDSRCRIRAYNLFLKADGDPTAPPSSLVGGARRRTYDRMAGMVDLGNLAACFIESADGTCEVKRSRS
jgi:hypothetical protein